MMKFEVADAALAQRTFSFRTDDMQTAINRLCTRVYGEPSTGQIVSTADDLITIHPYPKSDKFNKSLRLTVRRLA